MPLSCIEMEAEDIHDFVNQGESSCLLKQSKILTPAELFDVSKRADNAKSRFLVQ